MRYLRALSSVLAGFGGVCTILMMVQIVIDVFSRWLLGQPVPGTMEIVSVYYLVPLTFLPLAAIQLADRHIAVDLFIQFAPENVRRPIALAMTTLALAFTAWLGWVSFEEAFGSLRIGEVIESAASIMIIWPSRFILAFGIAVLVVVLVVQFVSEARGLSRRKSDGGNV